MSSSSICGKNLKLSIFGASHDPEIGMHLEGIPAGTKIDPEKLAAFMARRAPGRNPWSTPRKEADLVEFRAGVERKNPEVVDCGSDNGEVSCQECSEQRISNRNSGGRYLIADGSTITAVIRNTNTKSSDYDELKCVPRPGHADYAAYMKYGLEWDNAGGGQFSGRMTAPLCIAGGICLQLLERRGIRIFARLVSVGEITDSAVLVRFEEAEEKLKSSDFPVASDEVAAKMKAEIEKAAADGDSVGGVVECIATGLPVGLGGPLFEGLEGRLAQVVFAIPAVKGVEFGAGFGAARMRGSENNDEYCIARYGAGSVGRETDTKTGDGAGADAAEYSGGSAESVINEGMSAGNAKIGAPAGGDEATDNAGIAGDAKTKAGARADNAENANGIGGLADAAPMVRTLSNNAGGVLGGISTGEPLVFRAAFKPTPSIAKEQRSVDLRTMTETAIAIKGRHDPCVAVRAVPAVEAAAAIAIYDMLRTCE